MASEPKHRILITGSSGFVGTVLKGVLADEVASGACALFGLGYRGGEGCDILDPDAVAAKVRDIRPTAVVHLAAIAAPADARRDPRQAWKVNLTGTMNLAEAVMRSAPQARFVFVGSSEVYGASFVDHQTPLDEEAPMKPLGVYAATKAAADLMIGQMARDGLRAIRFRPFNHTGPGQTAAYVVPAFASQIAEIVEHGKPPEILVGNLDSERDFLDVRDVARAYAAAALGTGDAADGDVDQVYNLASGKPCRIGSILEQLIALSGRTIEVTIDPARLRVNDVPRASGNAEKAAQTFGWRPRIALSETLSDILNYHLAKASVRD